jgi:hypothetical protein
MQILAETSCNVTFVVWWINRKIYVDVVVQRMCL